MLFGYDADISSTISSNETRIRTIARQVLADLSSKRQEDDELRRPLVFICHSLGGLVIKQALVLAARDGDDGRDEIYRSTIGVVFFGTPNLGSNADKKKRIQILKNIAKTAFSEIPPKIEVALKLHSNELLDLADDFRKLDICETNRLRIYSYHETHKTKSLGELVSPRWCHAREQALTAPF